MRLITLALAALLAAPPAWALEHAKATPLDSRSVTVPYVAGQIYAVHVPQGQAMVITLAPDEIATFARGADPATMRSSHTGNIVVLWTFNEPVAPRTVIIVTRKADGSPSRTYLLLVDSVPPAQAQISLTFTYPAEEAAKRAAAWRQAKAEREQKAAVADAATAAARAGEADQNVQYVLQGEKPGDWDLLPTRRVSDDGASTHFWFPGNMQVPLIYVETPDGKPAVVTPSFDSTTGIATVHQVARAWHLMGAGDTILCVFNQNYDPIGVRSESGTASPEVERVTK